MQHNTKTLQAKLILSCLMAVSIIRTIAAESATIATTPACIRFDA